MLELKTPKIRTDQKLAAEFQPKKLETWLQSLPRADRSSCGRRIRKALEAQNRLALSPAIRLELMEMYLATFRDIYVSPGDKRVSSAPLDPYYRSKQQELLKLWDTLATGYKVAVLELVEQHRGQSRMMNLALALQRAMHCLGEITLTAYEMYTQPPGGTWRELHELYRYAEREDVQDVEVLSMADRSELQNALETYLPILLVGASAPLGLQPGEARRLYELAPRWQSVMRITDDSESYSEPGHFCVNLESDAPPIPFSKTKNRVDEGIRVFRTLGVAREMHEALTGINDASAREVLRDSATRGADSLDTELFRRAGRILGEVDVRRVSNRVAAYEQLEFCSGFTSVYFFCNDERPFDPTTVAPAFGIQPEGVADDDPEQFIDLGEPMLGRSLADGDSAAEIAHGPILEGVRYQAEVIDQSAGGLGLVLPRDSDVRLKVGDIAACHTSAGSKWQLVAVRWMRVGRSEVKCGVQFLGPQALPVAAASNADAEANAQPSVIAAIWLPENPALKQPNSVLLPRGVGTYPDELKILGRGKELKGVRLLRRIDRTSGYEHFLVSVESPVAASNNSLSS